MDQYCYFHPSSIAKWQCTQCSRCFDNACLTKTNDKQPSAKCPNCQSRLKYLPVEKENQTSFSFSLFSIVKDCLNPIYAYLLITSILIGLIASLTELARLYQLILINALIFFLCFHYARAFAYELHNQHQLAHRPKRKQTRLKSRADQLSFAISLQLTLLSLFWLLFPTFCFYSLHWAAGLILIILCSVSFAFLLIFSLHTREDGCSLQALFKQIKPLYSRLGFTGLILMMLLLLSYELAEQILPSYLALPLLSLLFMSALCIITDLSCKTFFYGVRQCHALKQSLPEVKSQPSIYDREQVSNLSIDLDHALKNGNYPKVVSLLEESLKRNSNSMLRREQLFLVLMEMKDFEKLQRFSGLFLHWMIERNKIKDASKFIYLLRKKDPSFLLQDIELMLLLAKHFLRTKRFAQVLWIAEGSTKRFQPSESLTALQIAAAQAHITHYKDLPKAEEILLHVFNQYSQFPSAASAKALLLHIQNHIKNQKELKS